MLFKQLIPSIMGMVLTSVIAQSALACLELPHDPPPTEVYCFGEVNGVEQVKVVLPHYTTFAESEGYCACALNIPIQFGTVHSAQIVDATTQIPFAGFSFSPNANSGNGFPSNPPNSPQWQGFSSQVQQTINGGLDVDIVFYVTSHGDRKVKCDDVVNYLSNAEELAATDAADENGVSIGKHQGILKNPGIRVIKKDVSDLGACPIPVATFSSSIKGKLHIPVLSAEFNLPNVPSYVEFYEVDMIINPNTACGAPSFLITQAEKLEDIPSTDVVDASNPDNPIDWVGQAHNQGVKFVLEQIQNLPSGEVDAVVIKKLVAEYFQLDAESIPEYRDISVDELIKNSLGKSIISDSGAKFLRKLFEIVDADDFQTLSQFLQEVKTLEADASRTLEEKELGIFYASASIARHSGKLWADSKQVKVDEVILADAMGFISGYEEGGIWIGVINAVAESAKELVRQLLKR